MGPTPTEVGLGGALLLLAGGLLRELRSRGKALERMVEVVARNNTALDEVKEVVRELKVLVGRVARRTGARGVEVRP